MSRDDVTPLGLPSMGNSEKSVIAYVKAVNMLLAAGEIPQSVAKGLQDGASIMLRAMRQSASRKEMDDLRALVARVEKRELHAAKVSSAQRQHLKSKHGDQRTSAADPED